MGFHRVDLVRGQWSRAVVAVGACLVDDRVETGDLLVVPGHQERADALDGPGELIRALLEQPVTARDKPGFHAPRLGVEAGVPDGGIRLARACTHIAARLNERDPSSLAGERARDGAAHRTRADDGDVVRRLAVRRHDASSASAKTRTRADASSAVTAGR